MQKPSKPKCVLVIGSGPIVIGQACEFDYSGTQAAQSLREEGIQVVLINPNPATIMTDPTTADAVYFLPLVPASIRQILTEHPIEAVLPTMGGQTALNLAMDCQQLFEEKNIRLLGTPITAIACTEDRAKFSAYIQRLGLATCEGYVATSLLQGKEIAQKLGFPLILRASFTLGGKGGGVVYTQEALEEALQNGLEASPIHEVLVEKSILGWKEYELEILCDAYGDFIVVCPIENVDPMGIHTGDSITVAPTMTLSDTAYQRMRTAAKVIAQGLENFAGGCNVQFALHPQTEELIVIEVNPRVSRSSALASKATGYPIAKLATKLALGYPLRELKNAITQTTTAFFEPVLDYVVVKIPRWNFEKFPAANPHLGLQMKAVGEVMALGTTFQEALLKACYSLEIDLTQFFSPVLAHINQETLLQDLKQAKDNRLFAIFQAFRLGITRSTIERLTQIDPWFLQQIEEWVQAYTLLRKYNVHTIPADRLLVAKQQGFSDELLAKLWDCTVAAVFAKRKKDKVLRHWRMVDTCAAEFKAQTPYYYSAFAAPDELSTQVNESVVSAKSKVLILGAGPNRIGQGIEFDYCCVHGVYATQACGYEALMLNCNPETVSTDFNTADKLYFEPVYWEYVHEVIAHEKPLGVIVQLGGQTALKLAQTLQEYSIPIIGTSYEHMDLAEDRGRFSNLLKEKNIPYPPYSVVQHVKEALSCADELGFPLLVRPSYVLGGERMKIVINREELETHVRLLLRTIPNNRILLDKFLENAIEAEVDALCDGKEVHIMGVMQHIEPAGIHSGDSYAVLPPYNLGDLVLAQIKKYTELLAHALQIRGLVNIQFAIYQDVVYVIEANPRASRTTPFICKARQTPYVHYAVEIMLGKKMLKDYTFPPFRAGYAIKEPVFSFDKLGDGTKALGPEMKSTGEAIYFIEDLMDPYFQRLYAERNMYLSR